MKRMAAMIMVVLIASIGCAGSRPAVIAVDEPGLRSVHFDTGSDQLTSDARRTLKENVAWLVRHHDDVVVLEGHCDERGDAAYNLQLGDLRARAVKAFLIAQDIDDERLIMVVSYGERQPVDPRHTADAWRRNRRVEFIIR